MRFVPWLRCECGYLNKNKITFSLTKCPKCGARLEPQLEAYLKDKSLSEVADKTVESIKNFNFKKSANDFIQKVKDAE